MPLEHALFSRCTLVAQVYGFDTRSETRIDAQAMEVQLATAESLAGLVMATRGRTRFAWPQGKYHKYRSYRRI